MSDENLNRASIESPGTDGSGWEQLDESDLGPLTLMDGERLHTVLHLKNGLTDGPVVHPDALLLTDRRVVHLHSNGRRSKAEFASINDVATVNVSVERQGYGPFLWAILAVIAAVFLWSLIDNPIGSYAASIAVALLGVYLVADRLAQPKTALVTFDLPSAQLQSPLKGDRAMSDVYIFIARLYQLKDRPDQQTSRHSHGFPPC